MDTDIEKIKAHYKYTKQQLLYNPCNETLSEYIKSKDEYNNISNKRNLLQHKTKDERKKIIAEIKCRRNAGESMISISESTGIPYYSLQYYIKKK